MENTQIPGSFLRGRDLGPAGTQAELPSQPRAPCSDQALMQSAQSSALLMG